jgi:uncharacterized lipoprotein
MMRSFWVLVCVAAVLPVLDGCRSWRGNACHKPQPYAGATSVPPLKIPQGLDAPDTTSALKLPTLNEPPPPRRTAKEPCLDQPPPFKVAKPAAPPQA